MKYIPFIYHGNEIAGGTAAEILSQTFDISHQGMAGMFWVTERKQIVGIVLETEYAKLEESEFGEDFTLFTPVTIKLYKSTFTLMFNFVKSDKRRVSNERIFYSIDNLEECFKT